MLELWTRNRKMEIAAMAPDFIKRRWIPFQCRTCLYNATYNAWLSSTAAKRCARLLLEDLRPQRLGMKYCMDKFIWQPHFGCAMTINYRRLITQKQLCLRTSEMTLNYISSTIWNWEGRRASVLTKTFSISLKMETNFQVHIARKASLGDRTDGQRRP